MKGPDFGPPVPISIPRVRTWISANFVIFRGSKFELFDARKLVYRILGAKSGGEATYEE
jgi:hypothetical protein